MIHFLFILIVITKNNPTETDA